MKITVSAPEGVFPEGARLHAASVPVYKQRMVDEAIESERDSDANVAVSYTFDIKVLDPDGNELQPPSDQNITVAFSLAEAADQNLDAQIYHVSDEGQAQALDTSTSGDTASAVSDGFSYYTVEFTYGTLTYVLPGGDEVPLSEILSAVGLSGAPEAARSSNDALFTVSNDSGEWTLYSLQSFTSDETLTVTIQGIDYKITVTDPAFYNIWVGMKQVTSDNLDDILNDGGSAKYDPALHILTLDNPSITGLRDESQIYATGPSSEFLIITGKASLTNAGAQYGIKLDGGMQLEIGVGDITAKGTRSGIYAIGDVNLGAATLDADGGENGVYSMGDVTCTAGIITATGGKNGIYANKAVSITAGTVDAKGGEYGVSAKEKISVSGGTLTGKGDYYHGIYTKGDISVKKDGIVSATGKQKGIFAEGAITLSGKAEAAGDEDGIYAKDKITADGETLKAEGKTGYGLYAVNALSLSASSVNATGQKAGIYSDSSDITILKGTVAAKGSSYGIFSNVGKVEVCNEIDAVTADGSGGAVRGKPLTLQDKVAIQAPDPGVVATDSEGYDTIAPDGGSTPASHVELISKLGYTVTFDANGHGTAPASQFVKPNNKATKPEDPKEDGFLFKGWFMESACTTEYDFSQNVTADLTLYAKWTEDPSIPVHKITVQNIPYPIAGKNPVYDGATVVETGIHMRGIGGWQCYDSEAGEWKLIKETDTFDSAKSYRTYVYVNAEEGYRIATDAECTINGKSAYSDAWTGDPVIMIRTNTLPVAEPSDALYVVTAGSLNVRATPGYDGDRIGGIKYGDVIEARGKQGSWVLIDYDGKQGWVDSKYLALTYSKETAIKPIKYTVTGAGAVNVRADISTDSKRIGGLTYMKEVLVTGIRTDADGEKWLVMDYNGDYGRQLGYVVAKYTHTDSSVEFTYEETEPEKNTNAESAKEDAEDNEIKIEGKDPKVTMGGVVIWSGRSAIAHDAAAKIEEDHIEAPGDGTGYVVIYPDDAKNYSALTKDKISLPSDWKLTVMELTLQDDGGIKLRLGPINPVTVSFDTGGSTAASTQVISSGTTATQPETPVREGYTFDGWYADPEFTTAFDFGGPIKEDTTAYAKWTEAKSDPSSGGTTGGSTPGTSSSSTSSGASVTYYTITYNLNGGILDGKVGIVTVAVEAGKTITLPKPVLAGYTFDYWEGSRHEAGESYTVNGDHTFTAQWKIDNTQTAPGNTQGQNGNSGTGGRAFTGDTNRILLYATLFLASLLALTLVLLLRKRYE